MNNDWIKRRLGAFNSGWDPRNYRAEIATLGEVLTYPDEFDDMLSYTPIPYPDQGSVGLCVGWDGATNMEILNTLYKETYGVSMFGDVDVDLSPGWLYYWSRKYSIIPIPDSVEGSTNFGLVKALKKVGTALESDVHTPTQRPITIEGVEDDEIKQRALQYGALSYWNVNPNPNDIMKALYTGGPGGGPAPVMSAYTVKGSFKNAYDDGIVPVPSPRDKTLGGHSSLLVGWKVIDGEKYWINMNSWGEDVGDNGLFYIPFNYGCFKPLDFFQVRHGVVTPVTTPWYCSIPILNWFFSECRG